MSIWWWPNGTPGTPEEQIFDLDATQFAFSPGRLQVGQGDHVVINVTASDVVHGFYLDGYGLETRVEPGITQRVEFVAEQTGKFRYRCSVGCGSLHPFMIGELVVSPNNPFWKAVLIVFITIAAMLIHILTTGPKGVANEQN